MKVSKPLLNVKNEESHDFSLWKFCGYSSTVLSWCNSNSPVGTSHRYRSSSQISYTSREEEQAYPSWPSTDPSVLNSNGTSTIYAASISIVKMFIENYPTRALPIAAKENITYMQSYRHAFNKLFWQKKVFCLRKHLWLLLFTAESGLGCWSPDKIWCVSAWNNRFTISHSRLPWVLDVWGGIQKIVADDQK